MCLRSVKGEGKKAKGKRREGRKKAGKSFIHLLEKKTFARKQVCYRTVFAVEGEQGFFTEQ